MRGGKKWTVGVRRRPRGRGKWNKGGRKRRKVGGTGTSENEVPGGKVKGTGEGEDMVEGEGGGWV